MSGSIRTLGSADEAQAIDTIVLAFATDPMARWSWPDPHRYLTAMPLLARAFGGRAFEHDSAWAIEECGGVALWLPPGVHPDEEALEALTTQTMAASQQADANVIFEQMGRYHPSEPHWYLPLIGVDPTQQGRGFGGALLTHALERCDRDRLPAYLESSSPRNIPLYQRHGFEVMGAIQSGSSPTVTPMLRRAK